MTILGKGDKAPEFNLPTGDGETFSLSAQQGKYVVLFFYPKDDTQGCTNENLDFSALFDDFTALGVQVAGVSPDGVDDHARFAKKFDLKWPLIADPDLKAIGPYGVWGEKKTFGKTYMGLIRTSFLIAPDGTIAAKWVVKRVKNHALDVLTTARNLIA